MARCARGRVLLLALLTALLAVPLPASAQSDDSGVADGRRAVDALRAQVERVGDELAQAAVEYEAGQARLDELRQLEFATSVDAEEGQRRVRQAQVELDRLVRSVYRSPGRPELAAWLRGDLQAIGDYRLLSQRLGSVADERRDVVQRAATARSAAEQLEEQRRAAREEAQRLQAQLDGELVRLQGLAAQRQRELADARDELARAEAAAAAEAARREAKRLAEEAARAAARAFAPGTAVASGPWCTGPVDDVVNGFLPAGALCPLSTAGQQLAYRAAPSFEALSSAYAAAFGSPLCVSDSYRDYAGQVDVFQRKPALAATPGRSQHGWGLAVDLCGGVERFGTPQHRWMQENAGRFGFVHPGWAQPGGSRPEPWHWESSGVS